MPTLLGLSLLFTRTVVPLHDLFKLTVESQDCHLQMYKGYSQAEHSLRCLCYTIELQLVLRTFCGGEEVGPHEVRHEVLLIFAVLADVSVVDCSAKRFAVESFAGLGTSPEDPEVAFGAVFLGFLDSLHPPLHLLLAKVLLVRRCLEILQGTEGSRNLLEHLVRVALGVDVLEVVLGFLDRHFLCHQLPKSWFVHAQKFQALAGCHHCRSHPRISTKPLHVLDDLDDVERAEDWN